MKREYVLLLFMDKTIDALHRKAEHMKTRMKLTGLMMVLLLAFSMAACTSSDNSDGLVSDADDTTVKEEAENAETETEEVQTEEAEVEKAVTDEYESESAGLAVQDIIYFDKYEWGTKFDDVWENEITADMEEGIDYGYYEYTSGEFAKELVANAYIQGYLFAVHYDFDDNDELVSVMPVLAVVTDTEETWELCVDITQEFNQQYGEPYLTANYYTEEDYGDWDSFLEELSSGAISCSSIWYDEDGNQLIIDCYKGSVYLELVIIYNATGYTM